LGLSPAEKQTVTVYLCSEIPKKQDRSKLAFVYTSFCEECIMFRQIKVLSYPLLLAMIMASGRVMADNTGERTLRERIFSDAAAQAALQGQRFYNDGTADQLRHRVYEQSPEYASQSQNRHQHRYQYREKSAGQHMHQSGYSGRSSGGRGAGRGR
jgi:hypothetical protein